MTSAHKEGTNENYDPEKSKMKFGTVERVPGKIIINLNKNDIYFKGLSLVFKKKAVFHT